MEQLRTHGGWQQAETDRLWQEIRRAAEEGEPLRSVFEKMSEELHRKPNSIRNYYYMQLRTQAADELRRAAPFETFSQEEVRSLIREVLSAKGRGESVRSCVMSLSGGDKQKMLRLQNKYRSVLSKKPELIAEIAAELTDAGLPCPPVPSASVLPATPVFSTQDADVQRLFDAVEALLQRSQQPMQRDRMRVQRDVYMMQLEDLQKAAGELVYQCKELCAGVLCGESAAPLREQLTRCISKVENLCG